MPQLMLRYRAASFFLGDNGLYTRETGHFKEYPMEDLQEQVKRDISENANSEPFVVAESEAIETGSEVVEPEQEKVAGEVVENDENVPDFMKD